MLLDHLVGNLLAIHCDPVQLATYKRLLLGCIGKCVTTNFDSLSFKPLGKILAIK